MTSTRTLFTESGTQRRSSLNNAEYFRAEIRGWIPCTSCSFFRQDPLWCTKQSPLLGWLNLGKRRESYIKYDTFLSSNGDLPQSTLDISQVLLREQQFSHCEPQLLLIWATFQVCLKCNRFKDPPYLISMPGHDFQMWHGYSYLRGPLGEDDKQLFPARLPLCFVRDCRSLNRGSRLKVFSSPLRIEGDEPSFSWQIQFTMLPNQQRLIQNWKLC